MRRNWRKKNKFAGFSYHPKEKQKPGGFSSRPRLIGLKHRNNDLACDITYIFLPLWREIFMREKLQPSGNRQSCFYKMQMKMCVFKCQFEVVGSVIYFLSVLLQLCRRCLCPVSQDQHQKSFFSTVGEATWHGLVPSVSCTVETPKGWCQTRGETHRCH